MVRPLVYAFLRAGLLGGVVLAGPLRLLLGPSIGWMAAVLAILAGPLVLADRLGSQRAHHGVGRTRSGRSSCQPACHEGSRSFRPAR
jgi:hypothetical protein